MIRPADCQRNQLDGSIGCGCRSGSVRSQFRETSLQSKLRDRDFLIQTKSVGSTVAVIQSRLRREERTAPQEL
jgi:hypothetical protein